MDDSTETSKATKIGGGTTSSLGKKTVDADDADMNNNPSGSGQRVNKDVETLSSGQATQADTAEEKVEEFPSEEEDQPLSATEKRRKLTRRCHHICNY